MAYAPGAVERAMKVQEVIVQAIAGKLTWIQAAEILGCSARTIRRDRLRLQHQGYDGLFDRRRRVPSPKRAPLAELQRVLALLPRSLSRLQCPAFSPARTPPAPGALSAMPSSKRPCKVPGSCPSAAPAVGNRRRREPRACFGELLHLDGSRHRWLALRPEQWFTLICVVDDATKRILHAELWEGGESVGAIMSALHAVVQHYGVPMALYTDRAHWAAHTTHRRRHARSPSPHAGWSRPGAPGHRTHPRLLAGPRGRSERVNRTLQDRLVNEWRIAGITTVAAANRYLREQFLPAFNAKFGRAPADPPRPLSRRAASTSSTPLHRRRARRRPRQCRHDRTGCAATRQATRPPQLCGPARARPTPPQRSAFRLVRCARCLGRYDRNGRPVAA